MKHKKLSRLKALKNQLRRLQKRLENFQHLSKSFSWYRLIIFLSVILIGIPVFWINHSWSYFIIGIAVIIFNIVAFFHRKVETAVQKYSIYLGIKKSHIARLTLDWENIPDTPDFKTDEQHPFEIDLDITGRHSLHHLLDISVSQSGSQRLRDWLLNTNPDKKIIQQHQHIIKELTPLTLFRDKFLLNFYLLSKERLDDKRLVNWLNQSQSSKPLKTALVISGILAGVNWLLLFAHIFLNIPSYFIYSLAAYIIFYLMNSKV